MKKNLMLLLLVLLSSKFANGTVIDAPKLPFDFEQPTSNLIWQHITTEHFDIIFPKEIEEKAQKAAHLLEKAYPYVTRSLEVLPPRIPLVLHNQSMTSNAFVALAPRRTEWFVTPSIDPELSNTEWLKTLALHEFRHVVQFQKTRRGFNKVLNILLGEVGQAIGIGLTLPPWFLEGDAVGIETALSNGGRGRLPLFDRDLRALLLSGKKWNYDKAHLGSYDDYVPNHYVYGYFYTSWLRNNYGDLFLSNLANESADSSWNPLSFYNATSRLTGKDFDKIYQDIIQDLIAEWSLRTNSLKLTPYLVQSTHEEDVWTNYYYPQQLSPGKILALKKGIADIDQFVVINGAAEESLFYPGPLNNEYPYKLRNGKFAIVELELDPRWGRRDFSRIKVFDTNLKKFTIDKRKTKGRLAVLESSAKRLVYVEWDKHQNQFIVVLDEVGKEIKKIPVSKTDIITSIDWLDKNKVVFVSKDQNDFKEIVSMDLETGALVSLLQKKRTNLGNISVYGGQILYESPASGIDNIWMLTPKGEVQITTSKFGAYAPFVQEGKLLYNDYGPDGMRVVTKELEWDVPQESKDSFYPIYEKFSKSEDVKSLESDLLKVQKYEVKRYSQFKNSLNLHSWMLIAPPLSSTVTIMGLSRDVLNKFTLLAGAQYDLNEQTTQGFVTSSWSHLYPVFNLSAAYGGRRQTIKTAQKSYENKWEEGTFETGAQIPWTFIQGRFYHSFSAKIFSKLIKVTNNDSSDRVKVRDGALFSPGAGLAYSWYSRMAKRDIYPKYAFFTNSYFQEGKDVTGDSLRGSIYHLDGKVFLPGILSHHSFYHELSYEKQKDHYYQYPSMTFYPRGTRSVFLQEFTKYSGNYTVPLLYPDLSLSRYLYLKRIILNLYYDELTGRYGSYDYRAASAGWESIFEMNIARIFYPISIGLRSSYILDGLEKSQNYEIFLATVLGTF